MAYRARGFYLGGSAGSLDAPLGVRYCSAMLRVRVVALALTFGLVCDSELADPSVPDSERTDVDSSDADGDDDDDSPEASTGPDDGDSTDETLRCEFEPCGGDVVGTWLIRGGCVEGTFQGCEIDWHLNLRGYMDFFDDGTLDANFGYTIECPLGSCECTGDDASQLTHGTFEASEEGTIAMNVFGQDIVVDYCVDEDDMWFAGLLSGDLYSTWYARRSR